MVPDSPGPSLVAIVDPAGDPRDTIEYALRVATAPGGEDVGARSMLVVADGHDTTPERAAATVERAVSAADGSTVEIDVAVLEVTDGVAPTAALAELTDPAAVTDVLVGPSVRLSIASLRERFDAARVERVPDGSAPTPRPLVHPAGLRDAATLFGLSYLFYLAIGGFAGGLDLLTGAISAAVVTVVLGQVAFVDAPRLARTVPRIARFLGFLPRLCWEIAKANVALARVILDPRLPIEPSMQTVDVDASAGLERMVLANSITLTPGTLVVDVEDREFTVHSLTAASRADLAGGRLEAAVSRVFHGRPGERAGGDGE